MGVQWGGLLARLPQTSVAGLIFPGGNNATFFAIENVERSEQY